MTRLFFLLTLTATSAIGCSAVEQWKDAHPIADVASRATTVAVAAGESYITGNPTPLMAQLLDFAKYLVVGGSIGGGIAYAGKKSQKEKYIGTDRRGAGRASTPIPSPIGVQQ